MVFAANYTYVSDDDDVKQIWTTDFRATVRLSDCTFTTHCTRPTDYLLLKAHISLGKYEEIGSNFLPRTVGCEQPHITIPLYCRHFIILQWQRYSFFTVSAKEIVFWVVFVFV